MLHEQREQREHCEQREHRDHVSPVNRWNSRALSSLSLLFTLFMVERVRAREDEQQQRFSFSQPKTRLDKLREYDEANLRCAGIILAERERYERECRLLVMWAERVIARLAAEERTEQAA